MNNITSEISKRSATKMNPTDSHNVEMCSICLDKFEDQQIGLPDLCIHKFCADCLKSWLKTNPVCPLDRKKVNEFAVIPNLNSNMVKKLQVRQIKFDKYYHNYVNTQMTTMSDLNIVEYSFQLLKVYNNFQNLITQLLNSEDLIVRFIDPYNKILLPEDMFYTIKSNLHGAAEEVKVELNKILAVRLNAFDELDASNNKILDESRFVTYLKNEILFRMDDLSYDNSFEFNINKLKVLFDVQQSVIGFLRADDDFIINYTENGNALSIDQVSEIILASIQNAFIQFELELDKVFGV